jgi:glycerophosphoryl diester phosphodiesterase
MADGLQIIGGGTAIRLKWHRLRRRAADAEFDPANLAAGLGLGASMEVDLQARGDGGFAVLHDADLSGETTGHGPVARATAADLAGLRLLRAERAPLTSEALAGMLGAAHPHALLQLDMKNTDDEVSPAHVAHLAGLFGPVAARLIASGASEPLIARLAEAAWARRVER